MLGFFQWKPLNGNFQLQYIELCMLCTCICVRLLVFMSVLCTCLKELSVIKLSKSELQFSNLSKEDVLLNTYFYLSNRTILAYWLESPTQGQRSFYIWSLQRSSSFSAPISAVPFQIFSKVWCFNPSGWYDMPRSRSLPMSLSSHIFTTQRSLIFGICRC